MAAEYWGDVEALFFVLQPNETGETGSHQKGEVHVRRGQIGGVFPDMGDERSTADVEFVLINARTAEVGTCVFTHYGKRSTPEDRLRRFPGHWRDKWASGDVLVLIETPGGKGFVYYHVRRGESLPPGLTFVAEKLEKGATHGRVMLPYV